MIILLLYCVLSAALYPQQISRATPVVVSGILRDLNGVALDGDLFIKFLSTETAFSSRVRVTSGTFSVGLPPGRYLVTIKSNSFSAITREEEWLVYSPGPLTLANVGSASANITAPVALTDLQVTRGFFVVAASCVGVTSASSFDAFTINAPVSACVTGSNVVKGVLVYSGSAGATTLGMFSNKVPSINVSAGEVSITVNWSTTGTSGNLKVFVGISCTLLDGTATDDGVFVDTAVLTTAPGVANKVVGSSTGYIIGCASGSLMHVRIKRDKNDVADTLAQDANIIAVEGTYR